MSVFVDTGGWFSSIVPSDPRHLAVARWLKENSLPLVTTDYVVDEALTLLRARGEPARAISLGRQLLDLGLANIHPVTPAVIRRAWTFFRTQPQRHWSFTDCTSKIIMIHSTSGGRLRSIDIFLSSGASNWFPTSIPPDPR